MKKLWSSLLVLLVGLGVSGCGSSSSNADSKTIEKLTVMFVPSTNAEKIEQGSEPLANILKTELQNRGFEVGEVEVKIGEKYELVGEALKSGTVDIGFIPAGTLVEYEDSGVEALMSATRSGLNVTSMDASEWNKNEPITQVEEQVSYYNSIIVAGTTDLAKKIASDVNAGNKPAWEDLEQAKWCVSSPTSSSGYIYPSLWLEENYGKTIEDINELVSTTGYGNAINSLNSQVCDIAVGYGDLRVDYADDWSGDIWADTDVIGVAGPIMNDTISVSNSSTNMSEELKTALAEIFENIQNYEGGQQVMEVYGHTGYKRANSEDYETERKLKENN